jgi:soluble lytic murein transglycosylase-like protein
MIRLSYPSVDYGERTVNFEGAVSFGTDPRCEIRLPLERDRSVARHHGDVIIVGTDYFLVAREERARVFLNGTRVHRVRLKKGDRIRVGSPLGPEIIILEVGDPAASAAEGDDPTIALTPKQVVRLQTAILKAQSLAEAKAKARHDTLETPQTKEPVLTKLPTWARPVEEAKSVSIARFFRKPHAEVQRWLALANEELQKARASSDGQSSGHTMVILAKALTGLRQTGTRRWRRNLAYLALSSLLVVGVMGGIIWYQQRRITHLVKEKAAIDAQIQTLFEAMANETDQNRLAELEARLQVLMGSATEKVLQVSRANARRGGELAEPSDELERDIRRLLRSFNAETYAIPPIFKRTVGAMVAELAASPGLRGNQAKKQKYWGRIQAALKARELPVELGYITFTESRFEPSALSPVGAAGMWQLMPTTARTCGLTVSAKLDERFDPGRSSEAAACYLSKLLIEFGQESFMLVLASYNRGENGVRHALHIVALEPGGFRRRDFWHLYRLKLLPDETRDYVPRVVSAALVFENPEKYGLKKD